MADDTDSLFLDRNSQRTTSATMQKILDEMGQAPPTPPPAMPGDPGQPTQPDAPRGEWQRNITHGQQAKQAAPAPEGWMDYWARRGITGTAVDFAKDVGYGLAMEGVPQIIAGKFDAFRHAGRAIGSFGDWLDQTFPSMFTADPNQAKLRELAGNKTFSSEDMIGIGGEPTTKTGALLRGLSEFTTGFNPAFKALQAGKVSTFLAMPGASAVAMFFTADPDRPNFTNLVISNFPQLRGPVTDFLASDPNDNEALNRLRNAIEGAGVGIAAEGLIRGFKAVNNMRKSGLKEIPQPAAETSPAAVKAQAEMAAQEDAAGQFVEAAGGKPSPELPRFTVSGPGGPPPGAPPGAAPAGAVEGSATRVAEAYSEKVQPPGTQASPFQLSSLPLPSVNSTKRTIEPSSMRPMPRTAATAGEPSASAGFDKFSIGTPAEKADKAGRINWQGSDDHLAIIARAKAEAPQYQAGLKEVVKGVEGAELFTGKPSGQAVRVKDLGEAGTGMGVIGKLEEGRPAQTISDYIGGRIIVDNPQAASDVINNLSKKYRILELDDKISNPLGGYRAIHGQVEIAPGLSAEIQIVPRAISNVQDEMHVLYDRLKPILRNGRTATPEEMAFVKETNAKIEQGFTEAWAKQHWPDPMQAAQEAATREVGVPGSVTGKAIIQAEKAQKISDITVNVNWQNIDRGNLEGLVGEVADAIKPQISAAKRDVIRMQALHQMADALNMTERDLIARGIGEAYPAERILAAGKLMYASHEQLVALATKNSGPLATAADAFAVNQQYLTHMALLEQFLGASGEAGRTLRAIQEVHQLGVVSRAKAMAMVLDQRGGIEGAKNLSDMILKLANAGVEPGGMNVALQRSWGRWSLDAMKEGWALGFLWRPVSQVRNIIGNAATAVQMSADIRMAERFSKLLGSPLEDAYLPGEAMAYQRGQIAAMREAFVTGGKTLKTGERTFQPTMGGSSVETGLSSGGAIAGNPTVPSRTVAGASQPAISAQSVAQTAGMDAAAEQAFVESNFGKGIDFIGSVVRLPGRPLQAADDFFKVIGYRGYIEAAAHRQALQRGLTGNQYADEVAKFISNPPDHVHMQAVDHMLYATFNNAPGAWGQVLLTARNNVQPVFIALPYVRTPSNLFRNAIEHSPLAPVLTSWRNDVAAGGRARDLALAKMTTGSMAMSILYDLAHNGHLTGPLTGGDKAERESKLGAGMRPLAIRAGGVNVEISGLGNFAPMIAYAGAVNDLMQRKDLHPEAFNTVDEWTGAVAAILAYATADQSYLTGLNKMFGAFEEANKQGGAGKMGAYLRDLAGSMSNLIPGVSGLRTVGHAMDPQQREVANFMDAMLHKDIPGLSDKLIPVRDVFGHEVPVEPGGKLGLIYNFLSPFRLTWDKKHAAYNEMVRLHTGIERIGWKAPFQNVDINFRDHPEVLDMYRRLAGNELKFNPKTGEKIGFEDFINRVIAGKDPLYSPQYKTRSDIGETGNDSGKAQFIKQWAHIYREAAQKQIMSEAKWRFPDFYEEIEKGRAHKDTQKLPTYLQGRGIEQGQAAMRQALERPIQAPIPDRFGKPAVVPRRGGAGFTVPTGGNQ